MKMIFQSGKLKVPGKEADISPESLIQRIHRAFGTLPDGERKVADAVLRSPGDLAIWTASELAERTGVSNATVSRLFRRLGYASYEEARLASRKLREKGSPLYLVGNPVTGAGAQISLPDHARQESTLVDTTLAALNPLTLREIADRIATAKKVRLAGFRNSRFLADYATATLGQFRSNVELMNHPGQTLAEGIAGLGKDDIVIIIGLRRRPAFFTAFVKATAATGSAIVLIADSGIRETPAHATWNISCTVETPQLVDSYLGAMAVIRALSLATVNSLGNDGRQYLLAIERLHEELSELE